MVVDCTVLTLMDFRGIASRPRRVRARRPHVFSIPLFFRRVRVDMFPSQSTQSRTVGVTRRVFLHTVAPGSVPLGRHGPRMPAPKRFVRRYSDAIHRRLAFGSRAESYWRPKRRNVQTCRRLDRSTNTNLDSQKTVSSIFASLNSTSTSLHFVLASSSPIQLPTNIFAFINDTLGICEVVNLLDLKQNVLACAGVRSDEKETNTCCHLDSLLPLYMPTKGSSRRRS